MKKLHELLDTKSREEQAERVAALLQAVQAPVIDLVIRFDGRISEVIQVSTVGPNVSLEDALEILEGARRFLLAQQKKAKQDPETPAE